MKTIHSLIALSAALLAGSNEVIAAQDTRTNVVPVQSTTVVRPTAVTRTNAGPSIGRPPITRVPPPPGPGATTAPAPAVPSFVPPAPPTGAPGAPVAAAKPQEEVVGPFNFDNMPLGQVLDIYSELVNRTILRPANLPTTTFITLKTRGTLTRSEGITAIEAVLAMNGFTIIPIGDKFVKVVQEGNAPQQGGEFYKGDAKDLPVAGRFVTQIVQLKYIPVQDAIAAITPFAKGLGQSIVPIQSSQTLVIRDYSENIKRMMEIIEKIDTVTELQVKPEVIPIKYALASDIAQVLGSLTSSGAGISVGSRGRSGLSSTGTSGYQGGTGTQGGLSGQPTSTPSQGMLNSPATSGRSSFQNRLQQIVNRAANSGEFQILGEAKIISDERTNSLLIFANDQDMVMIKQIIGQLDVVLAQVLIEAIIMEVSLKDDQTVGVSYVQQRARFNDIETAGGLNNGQNFINPRSFLAPLVGTNGASIGTLGTTNLPAGFSYFGNIGDAFNVAVQLAATDSRVNVLSRPSIQTSHAVEARLFIGDTVPYVTGTYFGGTVNGSSSQYQQKEVGITMSVLPLINPDGLVVMDISQNIEQLGTPITIDGNQVPTTTKREALAKVAVRDRETIVLGGFISTSKTRTKSGVPYLKDIPLLGALFRNKGESGNRVELMVFLRPTVLPTPEAAALAASDQKSKLPGIKQAEFDIREEERKRNEEIEADMRKKLGLKEPVKNK